MPSPRKSAKASTAKQPKRAPRAAKVRKNAVVLLAGGSPQVAKGEGDAAALPGERV